MNETLDRTAVRAWLDRYVAVWLSYDPAAIGDLFSEQAQYYYHPFKAPIEGRAAIVAWWLENRDAPNTYAATYQPIALDGNLAIANGRSRYFDADSQITTREFDNLFVIRFDAAGQCTEFREWFMAQTTRL